MDDRPIGFFDSGVGGLSCIPYLLRDLPGESAVYFGDTARAPYGLKNPSEITDFAAEITDFLIESQNVKMVVIACNTVSAVALDSLRDRHPETPILGIIGPASNAVFRACGPANRIGVIGTKATIECGAYPKEIFALNPALSVFQTACPAFVPIIEEGIYPGRVIDLIIQHYLNSFIDSNDIDTLVLGCTHYSHIRDSIAGIYPSLQIIDPSEAMLENVAEELIKYGAASGKSAPGFAFYASELTENFRNIVDNIFEGTGCPVTMDHADLEIYRSKRGG